MLTDELRNAYLYNRAIRNTMRGTSMTAASEALERARVDVAAGRKRHAPDRKPNGQPWAAVTWQPGKPGIAAINETTERAGLRYVGKVEPESSSFTERDSIGWFTEPGGEHYRDGWGLMWGVVYQLPARNGVARFVAGHQNGGDSFGPVLNLREIFESDEPDAWTTATDYDAARDAATAADCMAKVAAEKERDYQTAWQAGSQYAERAAEIAELRKEALADLAMRRTIAADMARVGVTKDSREWTRACSMVAERVRLALQRIHDLRAEREALKAGEFGADDFHLHFWTGDSDLRAAFNEGAGEKVLA